MLTICSSCGLLTSSSQHRPGCKAATTIRTTRRSVSMTDLSNNTSTSLFTSISNEHTLFAGTLRDWCDPLLQGQERVPVPLCPRCVTCKCESLKDLSNSSNSSNHHHHHYHHPSCPTLHQHERSKTRSKQRVFNKPKRRASSYDPSLTNNNKKPEHPSSLHIPKRKKSTSKIPVRISTTSSSTVTTTTSEYSPASSITENRSINPKTKIPRPISNHNLSSRTIFTQTNQNRSSNDEESEDYDHDSLNGDAYQTPPPTSNNDLYTKDISLKSKKKNIMMMYCTTNHFDNSTDDQILAKKKKKSLSLLRKPSQSESSLERRERRFWHKEGRHSKSKATEGVSSSPINDLSSTTSSSTSSIANNFSSSIQLRKKSRPYRLASPPRTNQIPLLSDDSLSETTDQYSTKRRPRSAFTSYETTHRPSRFESTPPPPSVYLIELTNNNRPTNSFGLTKTITYVWKNNHPKKGEKDLNIYPRYSVEQVPPIIDQEKRSIPTSSRHITLQRGKTDYWQSMKTTPDSILTSSCQIHTGSATNLVLSPLENRSNETKPQKNTNGHIISITTTKRRQPSLLNQSQNTQWNIEGDGKQLRYSNLKWFSAEQLHKNNYSIPKYRTKRKQQVTDSTTDTGSSSEHHHLSAPPILQQNSNMHLTHEKQEVYENTSMNKVFNRHDTSSPINPDEEPQTTSYAKEIQHIETIENESFPQQKLNYGSTDEDVDEINLDYSEDIDRSTTTIQTYRDRLNARLNSEQTDSNYSRPRILSTEYSQITLDSGVDIASEQKISQPKIDELLSEQTTNQNDAFPLSDDSILDIESTQINDFLLKTSTTTINDQSISLTEESDEGKSYLTAITDYQSAQKTERGVSNISEQYYSADSDLNTSLTNPNNDQYTGYELENLSDDDDEKEKISYHEEETYEISNDSTPPLSPEFDFKLPTFGDWIDQVFTTFLAETHSKSRSTSRSSSDVSLHASQNTIHSSSSQILTIIENNKNPNQNLTIISNNPITFDDSNQINSSHRRSFSWPNDEQHFKDESSTSLNNDNIDFTSSIIDTNYEKNKQSKSLLLSSIESDDEEVINKGTMQNDYLHHHTTTTTNTDQFHSDDENFSLSSTTNNNDAEKVKEKEHEGDEKHIETGADNDNKNDKPVIQVVHDSSGFSFYDEEFEYREPQQQQYTDSHDSLLQPDHPLMNKTHTAASSTDDLSTTNHLSSSAFHSKDSALGLSDDNLNRVQANTSITIDDDDDDQQQVSSLSLQGQHDKTVDNNEIQDNANNNIDKNEMTCEHNNNNDKNSQINNRTNKMVYINDQRQLLSPSYLSSHAERTISSSSSEQLIPKEKQTGMYYPAFGSSAAIHLAEKYNCEWIQDVTSPTNTIRKSSTIVENDDSSDLRVFRQHQIIGDDDEFILSLQTLQPSSSCPNLNHLITREPLRERSYSLTTLDAYARLDITRDTLEQMWLSLLDLAFSDKDDVELGEYKLRHIMGLSNSYTNMNDSLEKSRSHGDIFSSTNKNQKLITKKSKSFDVTSLPKSTTNDDANIGLLQGAAISEPFIDRIAPTSTHSDTEANLLDMDNDSIQSMEQDHLVPEEQYSPINQTTSPAIKEPLNYVFHYPHQLDYNDEFDLEPADEIINYLPDTTLTTNQFFGDEDKQLCMSLGFDDDEATAALAAAVVQPRDIQAILADYRPHSLSTIPSSRESQYSSIDESDDFPDVKRKSTISNQDDNQSEHTEDESDKGEIESNISSPQSRPLSPIQSHSHTPPEQHQEIKHSNFPDIDHEAWAQSISAPIYPEDLSIQHNNELDLFTFTDNLTSIIPIESTEQSQTFTIDQIEQTELSSKEIKQINFIEQINENNLIDLSSQEDFIQIMDTQQENKSTNSTRTSISSIHDTHLDPNELAYRLARLDSMNISSPPKKTLADELAELGEKQQHRFETDSLDHSPPIVHEEQNETFISTPQTYTTTPPLQIDELTSIAKDIRDINQEKSISSLCTIVEDIHAQTNNQSLTKILSYHQSPPMANLQTIVTELHQTPIGKSIPRPQRPTHLQLDNEQEEEMEEIELEEQIPSPVLIENISIPSNIISNLEQNLASYRAKSPSPSPPPPAPSVPVARRISEPPINSTRYNTQRIDKVSDLEIVKQGKGFKIGYTDRQGTDQRVILTKRIEAGPDIMARGPHVRVPYKGRKILKQVYSSVLHTNGYNTIQEDKKFEHLANDIEVPIIGTNPQHFDESDMVSIDIDGPSTMLNSICESIVITQGSVYSNNAPKPTVEQPITQSISKSIFDNNLSHSSSSGLRHVVLDQHEEYLLDSSRTPTPSTKKDKIEVIDSWRDRTVIDGSSTTWRSPPIQSYKTTKHIQSSNSVQHLDSIPEPNMVQTRIAPSHDVKYRTSEHIEVPSTFDWNKETVDTPIKTIKTTRDIALSPILMEEKRYQTSSTSPIKTYKKVDRSCQYSPPVKHDLGLQCSFENLSSSTQVSSHDIPHFLITQNGTQTINGSNYYPYDDSTNQRHIQTISPLSTTSGEHQQTTSGNEFIRKLNGHAQTAPLTVTKYTDGNYYLPANDTNQSTVNNRSAATLERSADSGILVDEQSLRSRQNKANFGLQVDIKGSSSDSDDVSEVTQRPLNRMQPSTNGDIYEHHSELVINTRNSSKSRQNSSSNDKQSARSTAKQIEQQITQLRRERTHILDLLSLNWSRSNIWVELTEAKLNYIIGETDALLRSLSFDTSPVDSERVKLKMHQYEEDMAELTRQRLAVYRERLEDSKKQLDLKIDELELKKSSLENNSPHYSTLEYTPRVNNTKRSTSFLSTSAENLSNMHIQDTISSHPQLLDISFLTSTPSNQATGLPPRYPRSPRFSSQQQSSDTYRTVYRPTPRYPSTVTSSNENRYDYPRYRTTSHVTPSGNLSGMQGLTKSQQAILDETDRLVRDSQEFHNESASQFERARESLLSSETPIRLARANMAASRLSPDSNYLPNDVTLAELFKYEQSLAKETAKNTRTYSSISTSAES